MWNTIFIKFVHADVIIDASRAQNGEECAGDVRFGAVPQNQEFLNSLCHLELLEVHSLPVARWRGVTIGTPRKRREDKR